MSRILRRLLCSSLLFAGVIAVQRPTSAAPKPAEVDAVVKKAADFLKTQQKADGSFAPQFAGPGITALTVAALLKAGVPASDPMVVKGLEFLEKSVQKDGGIYDKGLANYVTCLAIVAFTEANKDGKYTKVIENASKFVKGLQYAVGLDQSDLRFGGAGYGKPGGKDRPDLSNTHFMVEALLASGVSKDDEAIKRALVFISRSQFLKGELNQQAFAENPSEEDKGGFVYKPEGKGGAAAGGLRSAGSMTYAGLKSFLYAGLSKDDPRVKAAIDWIARHYTVTENPGMGQAGLYYYYHLFAKAMDAIGEDTFTDAKKVKHDWRQDLFNELKKKQKPDGSWANTDRAFLETQPELATAFAVLSLGYCKK